MSLRETGDYFQLALPVIPSGACTGMREDACLWHSDVSLCVDMFSCVSPKIKNKLLMHGKALNKQATFKNIREINYKCIGRWDTWMRSSGQLHESGHARRHKAAVPNLWVATPVGVATHFLWGRGLA